MAFSVASGEVVVFSMLVPEVGLRPVEIATMTGRTMSFLSVVLFDPAADESDDREGGRAGFSRPSRRRFLLPLPPPFRRLLPLPLVMRKFRTSVKNLAVRDTVFFFFGRRFSCSSFGRGTLVTSMEVISPQGFSPSTVFRISSSCTIGLKMTGRAALSSERLFAFFMAYG
jgi:hypothetical protein